MPIDEHLCSKHIISPNIYFVNSFFNFFIIVLKISDNTPQVQPEKGRIIIQTRKKVGIEPKGVMRVLATE